MCDYSLYAVVSRPVEVGETLITTTFRGTPTRGFASESDRTIAVCILPGTELAFDRDVKYDSGWVWTKKVAWANSVVSTGTFPHRHHDTIEFPDGTSVLLTHLKEGQRATVLQLPAPQRMSDGAPQSAAISVEKVKFSAI